MIAWLATSFLLVADSWTSADPSVHNGTLDWVSDMLGKLKPAIQHNTKGFHGVTHIHAFTSEHDISKSLYYILWRQMKDGGSTWLNSFEPIPGWPRLYAVLVWMDERNSLVRYCWAIWEVQLVIFCVLMNSVVLHATREIRHLQCRCWRALVQISYLVAHLGLGWKEQMFRFPP